MRARTIIINSCGLLQNTPNLFGKLPSNSCEIACLREGDLLVSYFYLQHTSRCSFANDSSFPLQHTDSDEEKPFMVYSLFYVICYDDYYHFRTVNRPAGQRLNARVNPQIMNFQKVDERARYRALIQSIHVFFHHSTIPSCLNRTMVGSVVDSDAGFCREKKKKTLEITERKKSTINEILHFSCNRKVFLACVFWCLESDIGHFYVSIQRTKVNNCS